jgi:uncharacterized protein YidB (DUF937 family)
MGLLGNVLMKPHMGMFGGGRGGGVSPMTLALLGTLAYRTFKGKGRLADMLGRSPAAADPSRAPQGAPMGGMNDILSPAAISEGLSRLVNRFRENGHGKEAESWVATGANKQISPNALAEGLGEERISWLMEQTGMSRQELLDGLSKTLPDAVDELTPEGHIPDAEEARRLM